jgi:hypothetical protein
VHVVLPIKFLLLVCKLVAAHHHRDVAKRDVSLRAAAKLNVRPLCVGEIDHLQRVAVVEHPDGCRVRRGGGAHVEERVRHAVDLLPHRSLSLTNRVVGPDHREIQHHRLAARSAAADRREVRRRACSAVGTRARLLCVLRKLVGLVHVLLREDEVLVVIHVFGTFASREENAERGNDEKRDEGSQCCAWAPGVGRTVDHNGEGKGNYMRSGTRRVRREQPTRMTSAARAVSASRRSRWSPSARRMESVW